MGSEPGHPYVRKIMGYYEKTHFILEDGSFFDEILAPEIYAKIASNYGFKFANCFQKLDEGVVLYDSSIFASEHKLSNRESVMIHLCTGTWRGHSLLRNRIDTDIRKCHILLAENSNRISVKYVFLTGKIAINMLLNLIIKKVT